MALAGVMTKFRIDELSAVDVPAQTGARAAIMKRNSGGGDAPGAADHGHSPDGEGATMSSAIKKALGLPETATDAEVEAAITKNTQVATSVAALEAGLAVAKAQAKATDKEKAFMADQKMDDEGVCKFMAKSADERAADIAKVAAGDETVELEGRSISKRAVGEDVFAVMKAQAKRISDNEAEIAKAREETANAAFTKRATDEFAHLAGPVEDRAAVLKHLSTAPEAVRKAAETLLKAAEGAAKFAFSRRGAGGEGEGESDDPNSKLEKMAKDYAKAEKVSFAKAMDYVIRTDEGRALYSKAVSAPGSED